MCWKEFLSFAMLVNLLAMSTTRADENAAPAGVGPEPGDTHSLTVAIAQPLVVPGNVRKNVQNMEPLIVEAARRDADVVVFSECAITGYDLKGVGVKAAVSLDSPVLQNAADLAKQHDVVIVAGFHERHGDHLYNSAGVFYPDGRRVVQRKHLILKPERSVAPITPGPRKREIFDIAGFRCALLICSDYGISGIVDELAAANCDLILLITAGGGDESLGRHQAELVDDETRKKHAQQAATCLSAEAIERCIRLEVAQVACNQAGWDKQTGYFHIGSGSIIDHTGEVTAVIPPRFVFEHLRPDLAVGFVTREAETGQ